MKRIVVLGAGTSGWMAASAIKKNCPTMDVTIVYDSKIPTVGVGETLTYFMPYFMKKVLGLSDEQWMPATNATYKTGVEFSAWESRSSNYNHGLCLDFPADFLISTKLNNVAQEKFFADRDSVDRYEKFGGIVDLWYSMYQNNMLGNIDLSDIDASTSETYYFSKANKSIRDLNGQWLINSDVGYTYHYDAELVGLAIADLVGKPCGVKSIDSNVVSVTVENNNIKSLQLVTGETIEADIFIDCSGFRRMLVEQLPFTWEDSDEFSNNSAIVGPLFYNEDDKKKIGSSTVLGAMDNGWRFKIPLTNRTGNGYVFNSRLNHDIDQLADELVGVIGAKPTNGFRHITWQPGHYKEVMVENCIAFGLASGFTDPFDANNLSLTTHIIDELIKLLAENPEIGNEDIRNVLNYRAMHYYHDIDIRLKSVLRLSPRRDTEYYRMMADVAKQTHVEEQFVAHLLETRKRDSVSQQKFLWKSWTHVALAARYGIRIPDVDLSLAPIAKKYFDLYKTRYAAMAARAPKLADYYFNRLTSNKD